MANQIDAYKLIPVTGKQILDLVTFFSSKEALEKAFPEGFLKGQETAEAFKIVNNNLRTILDNYNLAKKRGFIVNDFQRIPIGQIIDKDSVIMAFLTASRWMNLPAAKDLSRTKSAMIQFLDEWVNFHRERVGVVMLNKTGKKLPFLYPGFPSDYNQKVLVTFRMPNEPNPRQIEISISEAEKALLRLIGRYKNSGDLINFTDYQEAAGFGLIDLGSRIPTDPKRTAAGLKNYSKRFVDDEIRAYQIRKQNKAQAELREAQEQRRQAERQHVREMNKARLEQELSKTQDSEAKLNAMLKEFQNEDNKYLGEINQIESQIQSLQQEINNGSKK